MGSKKCWACGPKLECIHGAPVPKAPGLPALPKAFKDPVEAARVVLPPIQFSPGCWWKPDGYWDSPKPKEGSVKMARPKSNVGSRKRTAAVVGAVLAASSLVPASEASAASGPSQVPQEPASAPEKPAKAPAKVKAPETPADKANALWTASGGSVASETAIRQLLSEAHGGPAVDAVPFAKAVLARLMKKNTRVAARAAA